MCLPLGKNKVAFEYFSKSERTGFRHHLHVPTSIGANRPLKCTLEDTRNVDRQIRFVKFIHSADIACICHCPDVFFTFRQALVKTEILLRKIQTVLYVNSMCTTAFLSSCTIFMFCMERCES